MQYRSEGGSTGQESVIGFWIFWTSEGSNFFNRPYCMSCMQCTHGMPITTVMADNEDDRTIEKSSIRWQSPKFVYDITPHLLKFYCPQSKIWLATCLILCHVSQIFFRWRGKKTNLGSWPQALDPRLRACTTVLFKVLYTAETRPRKLLR